MARRRRSPADETPVGDGEAVTVLSDTASLAAFCARLAGSPYVTVDTEFMRETTYWSKLCLIQLANTDHAAVIDPLAPDLDLAPFHGLLGAPETVKVFHSARQDIEIFFHLTGEVPSPLFDTQVAAMVCGFGDSVSYENLVAKLGNARIDKGQRFTDWERRPLTAKQLHYALGDVLHLRPVYEALTERLDESGRAAWVAEEMTVLTNPATYRLDPDDAWQRLKVRNPKRRTLAVLQEAAAWREREAQRVNVPRRRILRDEALHEIAVQAPRSREELCAIRGMSRGIAESARGDALIDSVARALERPDDELPHLPPRRQLPGNIGPLVELLKVLLKARCEAHGVAQKLIATVDDLEEIAGHGEDAPVLALHGWRYDVFGRDALALRAGDLALTVEDNRIAAIERSAIVRPRDG